MTRLLCVGSAVLDLTFGVDRIPSAAEKYVARTAAIVGGGIAANAAVAAARLGGETVLGAQLGDDQIGDLIVAGLSDQGIDTSCVARCTGGKSSYSTVCIDSAGERQLVNFRGDGLSLDTSRFGGIGDLDAVLVDTRLPGPAVAALEIARARGIPGVVDGEAPINPAMLRAASHVAFSRQGLDSMYPGLEPADALGRVFADFGLWVCVTDGAKGVWFMGENGSGHVAAFAVPVVDTLGAGDVWHGAFALALGEGQSEPDAIRFSSAAAALKCMQHGGRAGAPSRDKLEEFLEERRK